VVIRQILPIRRRGIVDDLFRSGYVDMGILNSTYLHEFYKNGFNFTPPKQRRKSQVSGSLFAVRLV